MVTRERPAHILDVPRWNLALYIVAIVFAVLILGLLAWAIHWIPYNALIFALVVCIVTLVTGIYMLVSQRPAPKLYNKWAALSLHILLVIFWLVALGLVANLASIWSSPQCSYIPYYGYSCGYEFKRDLSKRQDAPTYGAYYGVLAAAAAFSGFEFVLFVLLTVYLSLALHRHRGNSATAATVPAAAGAPPPQYAHNTTGGQAVPLEKYNQTGVPQQQQQQPQYQQPYQQPAQQYQQPIQQQQQQPTYAHQPQLNQYPPQDMAPRTDAASPVSQIGYGQQPGTPGVTAAPLHHQSTPNNNNNYSELSSPQHTGGYNPNVSELSSPQHTGGYNANASELSSQR